MIVELIDLQAAKNASRVSTSRSQAAEQSVMCLSTTTWNEMIMNLSIINHSWNERKGRKEEVRRTLRWDGDYFRLEGPSVVHMSTTRIRVLVNLDHEQMESECEIGQEKSIITLVTKTSR